MIDLLRLYRRLIVRPLLRDLDRVAEPGLQQLVRVGVDPHRQRPTPAALAVSDIPQRLEEHPAVVRQHVGHLQRPAGDPGLSDIALLNAGAALVIAGKAASLKEGVGLGDAAIRSGAARRTLDRLIAASNA